jgi:hypothetical protein
LGIYVSIDFKLNYAGIEDAFNPDKGYVFHIEKIEETNSVNSSK